MTVTVSFLNMKGGVGKSTLAVNFAQHLAAYVEMSKRVLLVDVDPQANASQYALGVSRYTKLVYSTTKPQPTTWDIFEQYAKVPGRSQPLKLSGRDVIMDVVNYRGAGSLRLVASRLDLSASLESPAQKEGLLAGFLATVMDDYDVIVIDVPPTETLFTTAAYLASDFVLIPVKPEFLSTVGLPLMQESLDRFHQRFQAHKVQVGGIVFNYASNYHPEETKAKAEVRTFAAKTGWPILQAEVPHSRSLPKGAREGKPLFTTSNAQQARKNAFFSLTREICKNIGL